MFKSLALLSFHFSFMWGIPSPPPTDWVSSTTIGQCLKGDKGEMGLPGLPGQHGRYGQKGEPGQLVIPSFFQKYPEASLPLNDTIAKVVVDLTAHEAEQIINAFLKLANGSNFDARSNSNMGNLSDPVREDDYVMARSDCSVKCGPGERTIFTAKCSLNSNSEGCQESGRRTEPCEVQPCPPGCFFTEWAEWSHCSHACMTSVAHVPTQTRTRESNSAGCLTGRTEKRPCEPYVPFCPPECPRLSVANLTRAGKMELDAAFNVTNVQVRFGTVTEVLVQFIPNSHPDPRSHVKKWHAPDCTSPLLVGNIVGLQFDNIYRPMIKVTSVMSLEKKTSQNHSVYVERSVYSHQCYGEDIFGEYWHCGDGIQLILPTQVCDGGFNCDDHSDEELSLCQGSTTPLNFMLRGGIPFYLLAGCLAYAATRHLLAYETEVDLEEDQVLLSISKSSELTRRFASILLKDRRNEALIDKVDVEFLERVYSSHHGAHHVSTFFEHIRNSHCETRTIELIVDVIRAGPEKVCHNGDHLAILQCIKDQIQDVELRNWVFSFLNRNTMYSIKKCFAEAFEMLEPHIKIRLKILLGILSGLAKVLLFYLDLFKDLEAYFILDYISSKILHNMFESVGGLNFDILKYYLLSIAITSMCMITFHVIVNARKLDVFCHNRRHPKLVKLLAIIFPIHFTVFESIYIEACIAKALHSLAKSYRAYGTFNEDLSPTSGDLTTPILEKPPVSSSIDSLKKRLVEVAQLRLDLQTIETLIDGMPQTIINTSYFLAHFTYPRMWLLLRSNVQLANGYILALYVAKTFFTPINTLLCLKNRKNLPMSSGFFSSFGALVQFAAIAAILLPKIIITSIALINCPYYFAITFIMEYLLICAYNWTLFGDSAAKEFDTISSVIAPVFYKPPKQKRSNPAWMGKVNQLLGNHGNVRHTLVLFILTTFLLYFPLGLALRLHYYKNFQPLDQWTLAVRWFGPSLVVGVLVYPIVLWLYYRFGHKWKLVLKAKYESSRRGTE